MIANDDKPAIIMLALQFVVIGLLLKYSKKLYLLLLKLFNNIYASENYNVILSATKTLPKTTRFLLKNKVRNISVFPIKPFLTTVPMNHI